MSRSRALILALSLALGVLLAGALSACGGGAGSGSGAASASPSPTADPVVLRVDGRPVHQSDVDAVRAEFRLGQRPASQAQVEKEAVRRELLQREAEQLGVQADPAQVQARRDEMVQQAGSEAALEKVLAGVPMTDAQLRSDLAFGVLHEAVENARYKDLNATVAQARAYYDGHRRQFRREGSVHLYGIQVAAERIAESALGRLREGRPFAEVARQFTTDAQAKADGGDMGVVALASLPQPFRKALQEGKPGQVVGPVQGPGGWFLFKGTDLQPARVLSFSEVRADVVKELTRRARYQALEKWLDAERAQASITRP